MRDNRIIWGQEFVFVSSFIGFLMTFSALISAGETTRSTELCQVDPEVERQFRENLQTIRNDCAPLNLPPEYMPATTNVLLHYGLDKPEVVRMIQSVETTMQRLTKQNAALNDKVGKCTQHRFSLHETRRELNRQYPPSCSGYAALIEESKALEKNISGMVIASEARVQWNFEVSRRLQTLVELARTNPKTSNNQRLPASTNGTN